MIQNLTVKYTKKDGKGEMGFADTAEADSGLIGDHMQYPS